MSLCEQCGADLSQLPTKRKDRPRRFCSQQCVRVYAAHRPRKANVDWRVRPVIKRIKREFGMHPSDLIGVLRAEGKRWVDIVEIMRIPMSTIFRYMREDDKGYYNLTPDGRRSKRNNSVRLNARLALGEIERGGFKNVPLQMVTPYHNREIERRKRSDE